MACLMLNLTTRKQVDGVIYRFFEQYPNSKACANASPASMEELLRPLGMQHKRSRTLVRFSQEFLAEWKDVGELHGVGKYARDSDMIFHQGRWRDVQPKDHALSDYHNWIQRTEA